MIPLNLFCPRHPTARVTLHVPGSAYCARCGRPLRSPPVNIQAGLFQLERTLLILKELIETETDQMTNQLTSR